MGTERLKAFSDGVLAIIITVMVLGLPIPHGVDLAALVHAAGPGLLSYVLSFAYVGLYWNNHHHMFQLTSRVTGGILWGNLHLLFWLSLLPFTTGWLDSSALARIPVMTYGVNLLAAAIAYLLLQRVIIADQGSGSALKRAVGRDVKGTSSMVLYLVGIVCAWFAGPHGDALTAVSIGCYAVVAILWFIPDRRIERTIAAEAAEAAAGADDGAGPTASAD